MKKRSDKRKRTKIISVRVTPDEYKKIKENAQYTALAPSTYLRQCGLKKKIMSNIDNLNIVKITQLQGAIGKVGGLLKAWLSPQEKLGDNLMAQGYLGKNKPGIKSLLNKIEQYVIRIDDAIKKL